MSILGDDILREIEAVKTSYAAKCHIELSGRKHASAQVERTDILYTRKCQVRCQEACGNKCRERNGQESGMDHAGKFSVFLRAINAFSGKEYKYDPAQRVDSFILNEKEQFQTSKSSKWQRERRIVEHLTEILEGVL